LDTQKTSTENKTLRDSLSPKQIVAELDKYIIGQAEAKRSVAVALRNRVRRQMLDEDIRDEVAPKNIIMIGSTGVGKTEIARRLARLVDAPFIKVEASKYTEVGYVGRDVESMIRDLTELAVNMVKAEQTESVKERALEQVEERLLDYIYPPPSSLKKNREDESSEEEEFAETDSLEEESQETPELSTALIEAPDEPEESDLVRKLREERYLRTREKFGKQLRDGKLEDKPVEISVKNRTAPLIEIFSPGGIEEMDINFKDVFGGMMPKQTKKRRVTISEARQILMQEEAEKLIDMDNVVGEAIARVENTGLVFLDEIDKIAGREYKAGPDVSREGVQRDILPIIEGCTVATKYGMVRTDHILFIAAGAFHMSKPSDLIPELQGRFPIRVELQSLGEGDFKRILTEPKNALVKQYIAMMETEDLNITISDDAIDEISALAYRVNEAVEDIGARRLHTIMEKLFEEISFEAPDLDDKDIVVDAQYVNGQLSDIVKDEDLSKYIL
jgi:ATP-dependent HslUV protease ATP-binding subunit HslU